MTEITDQELRGLVREAIARHTGQSAPGPRPHPFAIEGAHPSHVKFILPAGGDGDGMCVIEPAVRCTHCGYCQSYGH